MSKPPQIVDLPVEDHMRKSFIDYAMSVILDRALPDVRDGLKPVHRRILYAMREMGLTPDKPSRKSAGVVGEVLKLYHPHGDSSVYGAAVRMAQPWSLLHPLITGQGNFGSIDGDGPAAYRYTEMKLSRLAMNFFVGIDKETVELRDNFDATTTEPAILPVNFPNILINGTDGIAVGVATSIPPHNLREVAAALFAYLDDRSIAARELAKIMVAPDFPTGGVVHDLDGYATALETGRGSVKLRATWHEEAAKGRTLLVIDSVPYQVNKATLVEKIAELVNAKHVEDVTDLRDESNKSGIRVVVELRKSASAELVFNQLVSRRAGLEVTVPYNMMLLAGKQPRQMGVREIFERWVAFRIDTIRRAAAFDLEKARERLHVLQGFMKAIGLMDKVIAAIRRSKDGPAAKLALMSLLAIDEIQAQAILELRLQKLTGLELDAIRAEHAEVAAKVKDLEGLVASERRQISLLRKDLKAVVDAHGQDRLTKVEQSLSRLTREELVEREDVRIVITAHGYVKRIPAAANERQGRGRATSKANGDEDPVDVDQIGSTHDHLIVVTAGGQILARKVFDLPEAGAGAKGRHVRNVVEGIEENDRIVRILTVADFADDRYLLTASGEGSIKRTRLAEYAGATRRGGVQAAKVEEGDAIVAAELCRDCDHVLVVGSGGKAIRFVIDDEQLRPMSRAAVGTRAIKLGPKEKVVGMAVVRGDGKPQRRHRVAREVDGKIVKVEELDTRAMDAGKYLLCVAERGIGRKSAVDEFAPQTRGGRGILCFAVGSRTGALTHVLGAGDDRDLVLVSAQGVRKRVAVSSIRTNARSANGTQLLPLEKADRLVEAFTAVKEPED
jgi:DNA gyrase subunit A